MPSAYLSSLSVEDRKALVKKLLEAQKGKCFICEKKLDPDLHGAQIDIDHVEPLKRGSPTLRGTGSSYGSRDDGIAQHGDAHGVRVGAVVLEQRVVVSIHQKRPRLAGDK